MNKTSKKIHVSYLYVQIFLSGAHDMSDSLVKKDYSTFHVDILVKQ